MFKRALVIVLDGVGCGALPDADDYGDRGAATLQHIASAVGGLHLPLLEKLGLGCIVPVAGVEPVNLPLACWGKMAEKSAGKDSVTGHWELAGVVLDEPFATYPNGFPPEIIAAFSAVAGMKPLGNVAASGTDILYRLGEEHLRSGRPIVYTSTDSVFQIAVHENIMPPEHLYRLCQATYQALLPFNICRVIARPFLGDSPTTFYRTSGRHDFPRTPPAATLLDLLQQQGLTTYGIGKIGDLFAGRGLSHSVSTRDNQMGMAEILLALEKVSSGLVIANLVDFDMIYGHRLDVGGFAAALREFDHWLTQLLPRLTSEDLLLITADHGCDPTTPGTDHTREYVPLLAFSPAMTDVSSLGTRSSFADLGATLAQNFKVKLSTGESFLATICGP